MVDYFLHIPKTGGTSFTKMIDPFYKKEEILPYQTWNVFLPEWPIDISNIKLIRGHFGYGIHHIFGRENMRYFTMLRDPVERAISQYHHMTVDRINNNWVHDFPYTDIEQMLEERPWLISNIQMRHLAVDVDVIKLNPSHPFYYGTHKQFMSSKFSDKDLFEKACSNLKNFYFIGFLEDYRCSLNNLCDKMSWETQKLLHENILEGRPKTSSFSPKILKKIRDLNKWDFKLYRFARKIYKKL